MPVPVKYQNLYLPVKFFLGSYRAYSDGMSAIRMLESSQNDKIQRLSDWKIHWVAACTLLRASVDLFQADANICVSQPLANSIGQEWELILSDKKNHPIFWEFLRRERNNILHEYKWSAYQLWLDREGNKAEPSLTLLSLVGGDFQSEILISEGSYKGHKALTLVTESANWVRERIFSAIERAGLDPEEKRNLVTFQIQPPRKKVRTLLSGFDPD